MVKPELLAPAGNLEKLKFAIIYGADAVYIGGKEFSLRAGAGNFSLDEIEEGVEFAHARGKKVYVAINIFPHNEDLKRLPKFIHSVWKTGIDAVILSDPGILMMVKEIAPSLKIHLSTQANPTNWASCNFWASQGVDRIVLARELSLEEIKEIREKTPPSLELEIFVHGATCISYSGRCLISNYMTYRDANRGECAHPCRYRYYLVEEKRPGQYFPVFEDERGTYFFNSRDLCMLDKIPELARLKLTSYKIEGRMKSIHYVAQVTKLYRNAIDEYYKNPETYTFKDEWMRELIKTTHREFTHGFYFGRPTGVDQNYEHGAYVKEYDFIGIVRHYDKDGKVATVEQRNPVKMGEIVEFLSPDQPSFTQKIEEMRDEEGKEIEKAPHPKQIFKIKVERPVTPYTILRKPGE
jgi:putative protease